MLAVSVPLRIRQAQPWITTAARLMLAGILAWASLAKISSPAMSVVAVKAYRLMPDELAKLVGYGLPFLELALALLLLAGFATRFTATVTCVLFVIFIAGIMSVWARGLSIDCGCFGGGGDVAAGQTHYLREVLRDVGFLVLAGWIAVFPGSRFAVDGALSLDDYPESAEESTGTPV